MALRVSVLVLVVYGGLSYLTYRGFQSTPKGFIPSADMGYLHGQRAVARLGLRWSGRSRSMDRIEDDRAQTRPGVKHTQAMSGKSIVMQASGSNFASLFVILDEFSQRRVPLSDRVFRLLRPGREPRTGGASI